MQFGSGALLYPQFGAGYGSLNLTATSPSQSFTEPLTLQQAKTYLNLPLRFPSDTDEDDLISTFIIAAREIAEIFQGRDLVRKQWDLSLDYFAEYYIELRDPLYSVDLVQYTKYDGTVTTMIEGVNADYMKDTAKHPGIIMPRFNATWPIYDANPSSSVLIRFTSGFSATDAWWAEGAGKRVTLGMRLLISAWFNNRLPFGDSILHEDPIGVTMLLSAGGLRPVR